MFRTFYSLGVGRQDKAMGFPVSSNRRIVVVVVVVVVNDDDVL